MEFDFDLLKATAIDDLQQYYPLKASNNPADRERAAMIGKILEQLPVKEKEFLIWFYAHRQKRKQMEVMAMVGVYSKSPFYRFRDLALTHYCMLLMAVM